jgi:hypothetical protein
MASSMTKISSVTVGSGGSSSISFTGIPQTYTDLHLVISTRASAASDSVGLRFNSDTGSNYPYRYLLGNGASLTSSENTTTSTIGGRQPESTFTASTFGNCSFYIPNYTIATYKSVSTDAVSENNATTAMAQLTASTWSNTAAITSITVVPGSGNFVENSTATLYGITKYAETGTGSKATGGTVTTSGGYTYHTFFNSGMFTPTASITGAEVLIVAGGGAGSVSGGGAGGLRYFSSQSFTSGTAVAAIVGAGGAGVTGNNASNNGTNSVFGSNSATGGGAGAATPATGGSGGGGGGSSTLTTTGAAGNAGSYSPSEGNNGGGNGGWNNAPYATGGGGGAGGVGGTASGSAYSGRGGIGVNTYSAWASATGTGLNGFYAGGGGGANFNGGGYPGTGGSGGGGQGGTNYQNVTGGQPNTGGGGGGTPNGSTATQPRPNGGSGIVIVRYTT